MKRFLFLFCSAVLVCSLMIVPALAAGNGIISFTDLVHPLDDRVMIDEPVSGDYFIRFFSSASPDPIGVSPDFSIDLENGQCFEFELLDCVVFFCPASFMTDDGMVFTCCFQAYASDEEVSLYDYLDITRFDLVPVGYDLKPDPEPVPEPVSPIAGIFGVFTGVGSWLAGQLGTTTSLFWNGQGLTFLGVLSVSGLALAVVLLLVMVVVRFLRFGG